MAHVNLLPWRETLRRQRQRNFISLLAGSALAMGMVVGSAHLGVATTTEQQDQRNAFLGQEIAVLEREIEAIANIEERKGQLLARMEVIQRLQGSRPRMVHLIDEMVNALPPGVRLTRLVNKGDKLTLEGEAQSNARVSSYMRNLDQSPWLGDATLNIIKGADAGRGGKAKAAGAAIRQFVLRVSQVKPQPAKQI